MLPGIICWSCCWVCCCSKSIATAGHGVSDEFVPHEELDAQLMKKLGVVAEG